jgi:signal transduction histidine kinase
MNEIRNTSNDGIIYREIQNSIESIPARDTWKLNFALMVSHEFRMPLATVKIAANHIRRYLSRMRPEAIDNKIKIILEQADLMTHMLNSLLTLEEQPGNRIEPARRKIDIHKFFEDLCKDIRKTFHYSHSIHLHSKLSIRNIYTDDDLLRNIFVNLLGNAIKFSPGKPAIWVELSNRDNLFIARIRDEGIGICSDDMDGLFEPFRRGKNTKDIQGTGLGLSIVKKAVAALQGTIQVYSEPNRGASFQVSLPIQERDYKPADDK